MAQSKRRKVSPRSPPSEASPLSDAEQLRWLKQAVDQSASSILVTDCDGTIEYVNRKFTEVTGYTAEEAIGRKPSLLKSGVTPLEQYRTLWTTIKTGRDYHGDIQNRRKNGELYWDEVWISPIREPDGTITHFLGAQTEISARKRVSDELRASEARYRLLFESNPNPMWVLDVETRRFLEVNAAAVQHYGYTREEFLAMSADEMRPAEDVAQFQADVHAQHHGLRVTLDRRHRKRSGEILHVELSTHPIDYQGRRSLLVLVHDVTQRLAAERGRQESERRLRDLAETVNLIVLGLDRDGRVNYANPYFLKATGYDREEVIGQPWFERFAPAAQRAAMLAAFGEMLENERHPHYQAPLLTRSGEERMISWNNTVVRDTEGRVSGTLSIAEDITDRLRLERQFLQAQKMEAIGQLAGGVAHDFNNLLTVIGGYVDMLRADIGPADPRRDDLNEIGDAVKRASDLTRQLLLFGRRQMLQPILLDLNRVVENMEKMLRRLIGEDIMLATVLAPDLGTVKADAGQMEQVLLNLVVNARDAMPKGGKLTVETSNVDVDESYARQHAEVTPGPYVLLAVSDTGVGMTPEVQRRIFEPFFTTKERGKGSGLGLATVYAVVKESGGWVGVYSEPGVGTTFKVYLSRQTEAAVASDVRRPRRALNGTETILLVEDEPSVRTVAYRALARHGYSVIEAPDTHVALELAKQGRVIDLVLTDVVMPELSGRELVERLAKLIPGAKVLYMSGYTDDAVVRHGVLQAGTPFIQKPFRAEDLAEKVREVLDGGR